jgi:AhpD family alkylhydroperoxidase
MNPRLSNPFQPAPEVIKAMMTLEGSIKASGLEPGLLYLLKLRASQMNGCAFCIDMHVREAKAHGVVDAKLHMLNAWRESSLYDERERAALAWTEALTRIADTCAPDADYEPLRQVFSESEQVNLTLAIASINSWNRLQVGFRAVPAGEARPRAA